MVMMMHILTMHHLLVEEILVAVVEAGGETYGSVGSYEDFGTTY
jgi:hypothetical protein